MPLAKANALERHLAWRRVSGGELNAKLSRFAPNIVVRCRHQHGVTCSVALRRLHGAFQTQSARILEQAGDFVVTMNGPGHAVQFYPNDIEWQNVVVPFLAEGLAAGQPVVIVATEPHSHRIVAGLTESGWQVDALLASGQLVVLDAARTLDRIVLHGSPDPALFAATVGAVLNIAGARRRTVRVYGEMVDILCREGKVDAALHLEELWNAAAMDYHFALLCAYQASHFTDADRVAAFERVCGLHHQVVAGPRADLASV